MRRPGGSPDERGIIGPTDAEVREHLLLLLARKAFDASKRNRRFLSYAAPGDRLSQATRVLRAVAEFASRQLALLAATRKSALADSGR